MDGIPHIGIMNDMALSVGPIFLPRGDYIEDVGTKARSVAIRGVPHHGVGIVGSLRNNLHNGIRWLASLGLSHLGRTAGGFSPGIV